jgi:hypothetical protein
VLENDQLASTEEAFIYLVDIRLLPSARSPGISLEERLLNT